MRTSAIACGIALGIAALVGALVFAQNAGTGTDSDDGAAAGSTALTGVQTYKATANHKAGPLSYEQTPPVGGDHNPIWLNCGIYSSPVPSENAVHSMEHGAVWVTYRPDLADSQVEKLRASMPTSYAVLSPFPDLPAPVVASAWGTQLRLDGADDPRLEAFLEKYVQGPQTPEPGATCSGGSDGTIPLDSAGGMSKP